MSAHTTVAARDIPNAANARMTRANAGKSVNTTVMAGDTGWNAKAPLRLEVATVLKAEAAAPAAVNGAALVVAECSAPAIYVSCSSP
jgi:hypothetical protein